MGGESLLCALFFIGKHFYVCTLSESEKIDIIMSVAVFPSVYFDQAATSVAGK